MSQPAGAHQEDQQDGGREHRRQHRLGLHLPRLERSPAGKPPRRVDPHLHLAANPGPRRSHDGAPVPCPVRGRPGRPHRCLPGLGNGGQQHGRDLAPGLLGAGGPGRTVPSQGLCHQRRHRRTDQESNDQTADHRRLDPVQAAPQRVMVWPQPADHQRDPRHNHCLPSLHPGHPHSQDVPPAGHGLRAICPVVRGLWPPAAGPRGAAAFAADRDPPRWMAFGPGSGTLGTWSECRRPYQPASIRRKLKACCTGTAVSVTRSAAPGQVWHPPPGWPTRPCLCTPAAARPGQWSRS